MTEDAISYGDEVSVGLDGEPLRFCASIFLERENGHDDERVSIYALLPTLIFRCFQTTDAIKRFPHKVISNFFHIAKLEQRQLSGEYSGEIGSIPNIHATISLRGSTDSDFYVIQPELTADEITYIVLKPKDTDFTFDNELIGKPVFLENGTAPCAVIIAYSETHKHIYAIPSEYILKSLEDANSEFQIMRPKFHSPQVDDVKKEAEKLSEKLKEEITQITLDSNRQASDDSRLERNKAIYEWLNPTDVASSGDGS